MKKKKEEIKLPEVKELTIEEKLKVVQNNYGILNRKERLKFNKLLGVKGIIPGLNKPHKKGEYKTEYKTIKENNICKTDKCENIRSNGSSRCNKCKLNVK